MRSHHYNPKLYNYIKIGITTPDGRMSQIDMTREELQDLIVRRDEMIEWQRRESERVRQAWGTSGSFTTSGGSYNFIFDHTIFDRGIFEDIFENMAGAAFTGADDGFRSRDEQAREHKASKPQEAPKQSPVTREKYRDELAAIAGCERGELTDKQLWRRAAHKAHPDKGGTNAQMRRVQQLKVSLHIK